MKKRIFSLAVLALLATVLVVKPVFAETTSTTNTTSTGTSSDTATTAAEDPKNIEKRVAERKTAAKTKLDAATQKKIVAKCKAGQTVVGNVKSRSDAALDNRQKVYSNIYDALSKDVTKLEAGGVDVSSVKTLQTEYKTKLDAFNSSVTTFKTTISDLKSMDCAKDPAGFKATLETARSQRAEAAKNSAAVKEVLVKLRKTIVALIKSNSSATNSNSTNTSNTTTNSSQTGTN